MIKNLKPSLILTQLAAVLLVITPSLRAAAHTGQPLGEVDFRYALPWWQTAICLPDDPDKILAGKEGQLMLDFQGGPPAARAFGAIIEADLAEGSRWVGQQTLSPRVPIVQTTKQADGVEMVEEVFVVTPAIGRGVTPARLAGADAHGRFRLASWAKPTSGVAPFWATATVDRQGRPLRYTLSVAKGARAWIVFGLCAAQPAKAESRALLLTAEGAAPRTVDPVVEFGANQPGLCTFEARDANGDGLISLSVELPEKAAERPTFLNALWAFDAPPPPAAEIMRGDANRVAYARLPGGGLAENRSVILVALRNTTSTPATRQPVLRIKGPVQLAGEGAGRHVLVTDNTRITTSEPLAADPEQASGGTLLRLRALTLAPGETRELVVTVDRHGRGAPPQPLSVAQARQARNEAQQWWESVDLPYTAVQVPDAGVQQMIESCVRNIWQAREIIGGLPAFHVGPTVYRGLWVVDGAFLLESAALLGRAQDARAGIDYLMSRQKADGSFENIPKFWKENGIVLWTVTRHAMLTQDKDWLRARWPALQRVVAAIANLRAKASVNPSALDYRLLPAGYIDGGLDNRKKLSPEYSNSYWCLAGLKAAITAAAWLGETENAAAWQKQYDDFLATLRRAMDRDTLKDGHGNAYVPTMMANDGNFVPQKGQWAFCHGVYPGQIFAADDPLIRSNLEMLKATKVQGMVLDTGWGEGAIWTYFGSFYGHAQLWHGHGREAAEALYDFARHAAPTRVWREEQMPIGKGSEEVGDMPHNWASAEFIRLATHLLCLDRGDELHLLEGFPREWARAGMVTRLNGVLTPFGPLHMELRVAGDGKSARLAMKRLTGREPAKVVLHLTGFNGETRTLDLPLDRDVDITVETTHADSVATGP